MSTIKIEKFKAFIEYLTEITQKNLELCDADKKTIYEIQLTQLGKMSYNENSILCKIINTIDPVKKEYDESKLIFPFTYNLSQKTAIYKALTNDISLIQGPPGTGKTQTIINIIANLLYQNKKVAVISANNDAVDNVREKLRDEKLEFLTAYHAATKTIEKFFEPENQIEIPDACKIWKDYHISNHHSSLFKNLEDTKILLAKQQANSRLRQEIIEWQAESQSFKRQIKIIDDNTIPKQFKIQLPFEKIIKLRKKLAAWRLKEKHSLIAQYFFKRKFSKSASEFYISNLANFLDLKYYEHQIKALQVRIEINEKFIKSHNFKTLLEESSKLSKDLLYQKIGSYFAKQSDYSGFTAQNFKRDYNRFVQRYPVILSTTNSLVNASGGFLFDYVIMDEASQIDLVTAAISLSCAKNAIFVGDLMQLQHVVKNASEIHQFFKSTEKLLSPCFEYTKYSILKCLDELYQEKIEKTLLNEHYRSDPYIINFCNKKFYDNKLVIMRNHETGNGIFYSYEDGTGDTNENINYWEAKLVIKCVQDLLNKKQQSIGVIAPFVNQSDLIKTLKESVLKDEKTANSIIVSTVHKFQGKEKDHIIISTVKERLKTGYKYTDFLDNPNLLNVAVSRAKNGLYLISSLKLLKQKNTIYNDLYKYLMYYKGDSNQDSVKYKPLKIFSAFQLLHEADHPDWRDFYKNAKTPSEFLSENIIATELDKILKTKYKQCDFILNYPLSRIVNPELFKEEYRSFINCDKTHCDFVIIDKIDKSIKATIEVDGSTHRYDQKQKQRDKKKDEILAFVGIPLLRIPTYSSTYKERIYDFIKKSLGEFLHSL